MMMTFYSTLVPASLAINYPSFPALQIRPIFISPSPQTLSSQLKFDHVSKFHFEIASPYGSMGALAF